ncbi:MAG: glycogen debranching enzyme N-terminal domain-containing protein, partial [Planctomycetes bacterium]|nr:glycogen debranching enzyme N-terminal domain-containing protein [Planctomycetota bacterium]
MPTDRPAAAAHTAATHGLPAGGEWLLVDGAGGYGCGCVDGLQRRRYHGLWIVRRAGGARRYLAVAALDERIVHGPEVAHLLHAHWRNEPRPTPSSAAATFARWPLPTWTFRVGGAWLERTVALRPGGAEGGPALLVRYRNCSARALRL